MMRVLRKTRDLSSHVNTVCEEEYIGSDSADQHLTL